MCDISERCGLSRQEYPSNNWPELIVRSIFLWDSRVVGYYPNEEQSNWIIIKIIVL